MARVLSLALVLTLLLLCSEIPTFESHLSSETATSWFYFAVVCTVSARLPFGILSRTGTIDSHNKNQGTGANSEVLIK